MAKKEGNMKTFNDLEFKPHPIGNGLHAIIEFDNGYGVSVVRFKQAFSSGLCREYGSYTANEDEWELAILKGSDICYDTGITEDVIGYLKAAEVTEIMKSVQELNHG